MSRTIVQNLEQLEAMKNCVLTNDELALDVETTGVRIYASEICGIGIASETESYYLPLRHIQEGQTCSLFEFFNNCPLSYEESFYEALSKFKGRAIFYNGAFDIKYLRVGAEQYDYTIYRGYHKIWDTAIVEHLLTGKRIYSSEDPSSTFDKLNLYDVSKSYGIKHNTKKDIKKLGKNGYHRILIDKLGPYCMEDCEVTLKIFKKQFKTVNKLWTDPTYKLRQDKKVHKDRNKGLVNAIMLENSLVEVTADMELQGWAIDVKELDKVIVKYKDLLNTINIHLGRYMPKDANPNTSKDILTALFKLGVPENEIPFHARIPSYRKAINAAKKKEGTTVAKVANTLEEYRKRATTYNKFKEKNKIYKNSGAVDHNMAVAYKWLKETKEWFESFLGFKYKKMSDKIGCMLLEVIDNGLVENILKTDAEAIKGILNKRIRPYVEKDPDVKKYDYFKLLSYFGKDPTPEQHIILFTKLLLLYRQKTKLYTTYLIPMRSLNVNGIVYGSFNQAGTATGRYSSEHPNLQNIANDPDIKKIFIVPEGYAYIYLDYSNMEMRVAAHCSGETGYRNALNQGLDGHRYTGGMIFEKEMDEVTDIERSRAKTINFLLIYGGGSGALARRLGIEENEARELMDMYFDKMAILAKFKKNLEKSVREYGYVMSHHGRCRWLDEEDSYKAFNTIVQGGCAMFVKSRLKKAWDFLRDNKYESKIVGMIHDELIIKAPLSEANDVYNNMKEILSETEFEGTLMPVTPGLSVTNWGENAEIDHAPDKFYPLFEKVMGHPYDEVT